MQSANFSIPVSIQICNFSMNAVLFRRFASALRRSSLYGAGSEKAQPIFVDCALLVGNCSMNFLQNHSCWKCRKKTSFAACRDL